MKIVNWLREHKTLYKRVLCGVICGMMVFSDILPAFGVDINKAEGTIKVWQWERYDKMSKSKSTYSRILLYTGNNYATVNITINSSDNMELGTVTNPYVDWNATSFITNGDLGAMGLSNDGGTNEWIFHKSGSDWTEIVSRDNYTTSWGYGGSWEDGDHGYWLGDNENGKVKVIARTSKSCHYNNGVFNCGSYLRLDSCKKADKHDTDRILCFMGYQITFSAITADLTTVKAGSVLNINDQVVLQHADSKKLATIEIMEGGVMTVEGRFFFNGRIICHGTIIVNEGACIMPFDSPGVSGVGDFILEGGELIIQKGGAVFLDKDHGWLTISADGGNRNSKGKAGTVVNNGYLILPHGYFFGNNSGTEGSAGTIYNREGAYMWAGYYMAASMGNVAEKTVLTDSAGGYYLSGMVSIPTNHWCGIHTGDNQTSMVVNDGYIRVPRANLITGNLTNNNDNLATTYSVLSKATIDAKRKSAYNAKLMSLEDYKKNVLLPDLNAKKNYYLTLSGGYPALSFSFITQYGITITNYTTKLNEANAAKNAAQSAYDKPDNAYDQYRVKLWSDIVRAYPYSGVSTIGSVGVG